MLLTVPKIRPGALFCLRVGFAFVTARREAIRKHVRFAEPLVTGSVERYSVHVTRRADGQGFPRPRESLMLYDGHA
jgi:hypothetical protein